MLPRVAIILQLLAYQTLTMPCRDCALLSERPVGCMPSPCSVSEETDKSEEACGGCCESEGAGHGCSMMGDAESDMPESAPASKGPLASPEQCRKCCPIKMPCDRYSPYEVNKPNQSRPAAESPGECFVGQTDALTPPVNLEAPWRTPTKMPPKVSAQSLHCIWLN